MYIKRSNKDKIGEAARALLEERNELIKHRKENRQAIAKISKRILESIRKHRQTERLKLLKEYIEKTGGIKKGLKQLKAHTSWIPNMKTKKKKGKLTSNRACISQIATEFYRNLYMRPDELEYSEAQMEEEIVPPFLEDEIIKAIQTQKSGKACGEDNISNELQIYAMRSCVQK